MPSRTIELTDRQAEIVDHRVNAGRYQDASEVVREGLRLLEEREAENAAKLAALRAAAQVGMDDLEAGRYRTFDSPEALDEYLKALTERVLACDGPGK